MEEIEKFFDEIKFEPVSYVAVFDTDSGEISAIGPSLIFKDVKNVISIDNNIAEMIIEGKINIVNCAVDIRNMTFELLEKKTVVKIDDVLHRVIDSNWTTIDNPDIYIVFDSAESSLSFELTEEFGGTYILPEKYQPVVRRKIIWDGDTKLNFYITEYNDPNVLYSTYDILLKDLIDSKITISDVKVPVKFSIYTRRVLKNYVLEIK